MMRWIKTKITGFTLLELLIAVAIVGILAAIAIPSYRHYIEQSNRTDAIHALTSLQLEQERYRTTNTTYASLAVLWGGTTTSDEGHYTIAITNVSATSYTITATATDAQASDTECATMTLAYSNGTTTKTPATCWD